MRTFTRISILVEHSWPLVELASDLVTRETNETRLDVEK